MMTRWKLALAVLVCGHITWSVVAMAAPMTGEDEAEPMDPPLPVAALPPVDVAASAPAAPVAATPAAAATNPAFAAQPPADSFPTLPPSRPCARQDIDGLWRLNNVYESPQGVESSTFTSQPHQYLLFLRDDTYRTYRTSWPEKSDAVVMRQLELEEPDHLEQFVVGENGLVYFYRDSVAIDTQVCFIVANQRAPFTVGQMLLMPPEGQSSVRLVKAYDRSLSLRTQGKAGAKKKQGNKQRKKGKGKNKRNQNQNR